jgi:hypothetical protein
MTIESELFSRLTGFAGLAALIGDRVYPVKLPQNVTLPAITYLKVSAIRASNFGVDTGDVRYRIQINCWSDKKPGEALGSNTVAAQVKAALKRYRGGNFQESFLENEIDDDYDDDAENFRVIMDFIIWFKE